MLALLASIVLSTTPIAHVAPVQAINAPIVDADEDRDEVKAPRATLPDACVDDRACEDFDADDDEGGDVAPHTPAQGRAYVADAVVECVQW